MGYSEALEAAGCKVLDFEEFGSYQGDWLAFVEYNGEKGIVEGSYGSCSGCDAFHAEFDYGDNPTERNGKYYKTEYCFDDEDEVSKEEYDRLLLEQKTKLSDFGRGYLSGGLYGKPHYQSALEKLDPEDYFDQEKKEQYEWVLCKDF